MEPTVTDSIAGEYIVLQLKATIAAKIWTFSVSQEEPQPQTYENKMSLIKFFTSGIVTCQCLPVRHAGCYILVFWVRLTLMLPINGGEKSVVLGCIEPSKSAH